MMKPRLHFTLAGVLLLYVGQATAAPLMYVPTGPGNEILIVDLAADRIIGRIGELENAHGLAASARSEYLVAGSMQPLEPGESREASRPAGVSEAEHAAHHGGGMGTPVKAAPSYVSIVQFSREKVVRRIPVPGLTHHTVIAPDGRRAVAVHSGLGQISLIDLERLKLVKTFNTGSRPNYALFSADGRRLYVSNTGDGTVSEFDTRAWNLQRRFEAGKEPEHMVLGVEGKVLFVANTSATVTALDLTSGRVIRRYPVGEQVHGIDVSDDGRWLFVSNKGSDSLTRIDLIDGDVITAELSPAPYHLDYVGAVKTLYVSSRKLPKIWVLDPATLSVRGEIDFGKGIAHQMAVP